MPSETRLEYLDGLRGIAAAWVLVGHALILTWSYVPVVSNPIYAVDLFMIISGLLMYYHAVIRSETEPFDNARTWLFFWTRRFFRIAPVYYCALVAAMVLGPDIGEWRHEIALVFPGTVVPGDRLDQSFANVLAHISFFSGFHLIIITELSCRIGALG
jgi:peptidoglycan/LPS O-acetylase OafA/YrhL